MRLADNLFFFFELFLVLLRDRGVVQCLEPVEPGLLRIKLFLLFLLLDWHPLLLCSLVVDLNIPEGVVLPNLERLQLLFERRNLDLFHPVTILLLKPVVGEQVKVRCLS